MRQHGKCLMNIHTYFGTGTHVYEAHRKASFGLDFSAACGPLSGVSWGNLIAGHFWNLPHFKS